jgi:hypothetical protein
MELDPILFAFKLLGTAAAVWMFIVWIAKRSRNRRSISTTRNFAQQIEQAAPEAKLLVGPARSLTRAMGVSGGAVLGALLIFTVVDRYTPYGWATPYLLATVAFIAFAFAARRSRAQHRAFEAQLKADRERGEHLDA